MSVKLSVPANELYRLNEDALDDIKGITSSEEISLFFKNNPYIKEVYMSCIYEYEDKCITPNIKYSDGAFLEFLSKLPTLEELKEHFLVDKFIEEYSLKSELNSIMNKIHEMLENKDPDMEYDEDWLFEDYSVAYNEVYRLKHCYSLIDNYEDWNGCFESNTICKSDITLDSSEDFSIPIKLGDLGDLLDLVDEDKVLQVLKNSGLMDREINNYLDQRKMSERAIEDSDLEQTITPSM